MKSAIVGIIVIVLTIAGCGDEAANFPDAAPDATPCYPVDDSCTACGMDETCYAPRIGAAFGCDVCVWFACPGWPPPGALLFCSAPCPVPETPTHIDVCRKQPGWSYCVCCGDRQLTDPDPA